MFPEGEHVPCDRTERGQRTHLRIVFNEPKNPHPCPGYPLGSCMVTLYYDAELCSFCTKTKRQIEKEGM